MHVCRSQQAEEKFGSYWNQIRDITSEVVGRLGNSGGRRIKTSSDISDVQFKELNKTEKLFDAVLGSKRGMVFISRQVSFKMKLQFRSDSDPSVQSLSTALFNSGLWWSWSLSQFHRTRCRGHTLNRLPVCHRANKERQSPAGMWVTRFCQEKSIE